MKLHVYLQEHVCQKIAIQLVMQENVVVKNDYILMNKIPKQGENCRLAGEDIAKGR